MIFRKYLFVFFEVLFYSSLSALILFPLGKWCLNLAPELSLQDALAFLPDLMQSFSFSLKMSFLSCFFVVIFSLLFCFIVFQKDTFFPKKTLQFSSFVACLLFLTPPSILSLLYFKFSRSTILPERGILAIALVHFLLNALFVSSIVSEELLAFKNTKMGSFKNYLKTLHSSSFYEAKYIFLPIFLKKIKIWIQLIFYWSCSAFASVYILSGSNKDATLEVLLYRQLSYEANPTKTFLLMMIQSLFSLIIFKKLFTIQTNKKSLPKKLQSQKHFLHSSLLFCLSLLCSFPLWFFMKDFLNFSQLQTLFTDAVFLKSLQNSLVFSLCSSLAILFILFLFILKESFPRTLIVILFSLSHVIVAQSWLESSYDLFFDGRHLSYFFLSTSITHALLSFPFYLLWIQSDLKSINPLETQYFKSHCSHRLQLFKHLYFPHLKTSLLKIFFLSLILGLGEFVFTKMLFTKHKSLVQYAHESAQQYNSSPTQGIFIVNLALICFYLLSTRLTRKNRHA